MWCRTILTAVAISCTFTREIIVHAHGGSQRLVQIKDVICMLLLSGLQKDDLDANTLEKLGRHNVNIDDMNNEKRRQSCLLNSYLDSRNDSQKQVTSMQNTEKYNDALGSAATNNIVENNVKIVEYPKQKIREPENLEYKKVLQDQNKTNEIEKFVEELKATMNNNSNTNDIINSDNLENLTKIEENNGLQIEYVENQPDLQSVMNFWTKLTHYTKTVVTKIPTTPASPNISEEKNVTTVTVETSNNNGYVHSREMEYISRMLAEYLASQTVPTTTQRISAKTAYVNFISRKTDEVSVKPPDQETYPIIPTKIIRQPLSVEQFSQINNLTQFEVQPRKGIYNYMTDETSSMPFKVSYESKYNQQIRNVQDTPYNQIFTVDTKTVESPKYNPIRFLDNLLHMKSEDINDSFFSEYETSTEGLKLIHLENLTSESFNLPMLIKYLKEINDNNSQILNRNQKIMTTDNKLKTTPIETDSWEPIRNYRMINHALNVIPIDKKIRNQNAEINSVRIRKNLGQAENVDLFEQYKTVPSDINKPEQMNRLESTFDDTPNKVNKSDQIQNFDLNNDMLKVIPTEIKKSKQDQNSESANEVFKSMLPSIKYSKRKKNVRTTYKEADTQTKLNKLEHDDKLLLAETNKSLRNQINKMNDEQFNNPPIVANSRKPETTKTLEQNSKGLHDKKLKLKNINMPAAIVKKYESIRDLRNQINTIPDNVNNSEGNVSFVMKTDLVAIPIDVKDLKPVQNSEMNINEPQAIPENIIREIAEKVKQIVLKDIEKEKEVTTTSLKPTPPHTTSTDVPTTITTTTMKPKVTTTEMPSTASKDITEANHVIQKLMEIFNEFKAMKESGKANTQILKNTTTSLKDITLNYRTTKSPKLLIQGTPTFNAYIKKTPIEVSPYGPSMVPISISSGINLPNNLPSHNLAEQNLALQNLAFQNPGAQNLASQNPGAQNLAAQNLAPQNQAPWYMPVNFANPRNDYHSGAITIQTNSDEIAPLAIQISKPVRLINQHIIVTTKSPAEKVKEVLERESKKRLDQKYRGLADVKNHREKLNSDFTKKVRFADNLKMHEFSERYSYKGLNKAREKPWLNRGYGGNSQHIENLDSLGSSRYPGNLNYAASSSHMENISHQRGYGQTSSYTGGVSQPGGLSYTTSFNRLGSNRNEINYQDRLSNRDGIRHYTGSYGYNEQDRQQPRYETSKFHERLERLENWPRNSWKEHRYTTTQNCCEEIPPRQQVPLTKVKQRTRFDDTHFSNFLKSQQKVTDMLEKILANNMKNSGARSVETP